jgi:glutamate racemase
LTRQITGNPSKFFSSYDRNSQEDRKSLENISIRINSARNKLELNIGATTPSKIKEKYIQAIKYISSFRSLTQSTSANDANNANIQPANKTSLAGQKIYDRVFRVGIVDSGSGGYIAFKTLKERITAELKQKYGDTIGVQFIVIGDFANKTYGDRSGEDLFVKVSDLFNTGNGLNLDILIGACNTACTQLPLGAGAQATTPIYDIVSKTGEFIQQTGGAHPVAIATDATANSQAYQNLVPGIKVVGASYPNLARIVNLDEYLNPKTIQQTQERVDEIARRVRDSQPNASSIWLTCTHYPELLPFFQRSFEKYGMGNIPIYNPMVAIGDDVAKQIATAGARGDAFHGTNGPDVFVATRKAGQTLDVDPKEKARKYSGDRNPITIVIPETGVNAHLDQIKQAAGDPPKSNAERVSEIRNGKHYTTDKLWTVNREFKALKQQRALSQSEMQDFQFINTTLRTRIFSDINQVRSNPAYRNQLSQRQLKALYINAQELTRNPGSTPSELEAIKYIKSLLR